MTPSAGHGTQGELHVQARAGRRVWKCATCRRQFSVLTGTVLEGTRVDLAVWLAVLATVADAPGTALAANDIARTHGVTAETARGMVRRIDAVLETISATSSAGPAATR